MNFIFMFLVYDMVLFLKKFWSEKRSRVFKTLVNGSSNQITMEPLLICAFNYRRTKCGGKKLYKSNLI